MEPSKIARLPMVDSYYQEGLRVFDACSFTLDMRTANQTRHLFATGYALGIAKRESSLGPVALLDMSGNPGAAQRLRQISEWIDGSSANMARDPEAATWGRLSKVAEEAGEVVSAFIGVTNQNPRKGVYATPADVKKELLDVAVTALAAYEHMTDNRGDSMLALLQHVTSIHKRAEIASQETGQ